MTRPMTGAEKTGFKALFPKLDVDKAVVTGENSDVYNCLAWTLGITTSWVWPGEDESDFDRLYGSYGFKRAANGPIAAWGLSKSKMTHGCISGAGHGPRWESKCGKLLRIQHGLTELEGASYGTVQFFYDNATAVRRGLGNWIKNMRRVTKLSAREQLNVRKEAKDVPQDTRGRFAKLYADWQKERNAPELAVSSNPAYVRQLPSFIRLAGLGPDSIPLVMEKIAGGDFFALQLYEVLQPNPALLVNIHRDESVLGGEQLRAAQTVRRWLSR